jgi:PEP-CTERM motif-containing protein
MKKRDSTISKLSRYKVATLVVSAILSLVLGSPLYANHLTIPDIPGLRTPLPNEGYLTYLFNPFTGDFGDEYTGWIDVRHPAMDGTTDTAFGFDRSDNFVNIRTVTVTDNAATAATPNVRRDFDFANKIYAQAGLSLVRTESGALTLNGMGGAPNVAWPINQTNQDDAMKALGRSANATTINTYYVQSYTPAVNGLTSFPFTFGGNIPRNDGSGIANRAVPNTFSHEIGHMLLNANSSFSGFDCPAPAQAESCEPGPPNDSNVMFRTGERTSNSLSDVGPRLSPTVGGHDVLVPNQIDRIFANGGANNPGFVQKNHHAADGDRVDWDFVADQNNLEGRANGADFNMPTESLFWGIDTTVAPSEIGHDHTGLGVFPPTPDFAGPSFRTVDVFSLAPRYADQDVNAAGNLSLREEALDYNLFFRGLDGSIFPGNPLFDFIGGWSPLTFADDYLARWVSPLPADGVFIFAHSGDGHDGNAQIDAIIASATVAQIPEPSTIILIGSGLAGILIFGRRRRLTEHKIFRFSGRHPSTGKVDAFLRMRERPAPI